jgi:hypothetical protein
MVTGRGRPREHPMDISKGVTWPSVTTGVAQLPVAHAHTQENPEGGTSDLRSHPVAMLLLLRKKTREKAGHAKNILPDMASSGHVTLSRPVTWLCHVRSKGPTSGHVTSGSTSANNNWAVPIYYLHISRQDFLDRRFLLTSKLLK